MDAAVSYVGCGQMGVWIRCGGGEDMFGITSPHRAAIDKPQRVSSISSMMSPLFTALRMLVKEDESKNIAVIGFRCIIFL